MKPIGQARDLALAAAAHAREAGRLIARQGRLASRPDKAVVRKAAAPRTGRPRAGSVLDQVETVHLARRHIKRARSLLRALKPLAPAGVERENGFLRAFAHTLAPLRDADAMEAAARAVGAAAIGRANPAAVDLAALGRALQRQARIIARLAPVDAPKHFLSRAVGRAYRRARRAWCRYADAPGSESLHEARKRIKDCLHLVEALDDRRPAGAEPKPGRLDRLGELMGAIRDLDLLAGRFGRGEAARAKLVRIEARRLRLEREVVRTADKAFARRPRRISAAWREGLAGKAVP